MSAENLCIKPVAIRVYPKRKKGTLKMLIPVLYENQTLGMVYPGRLDKLIAANKILAFRRSTGWVFLEEGPLRENVDNGGYDGRERRAEKACFTTLESVLKEYEIHYECGAEKSTCCNEEKISVPSELPSGE